MMADKMSEYLSSLNKLQVLNKKNTRSTQLMRAKYAALNKIFGPFYKLFLQIKDLFSTATGMFTSSAEEVEEFGEAVEEAMGPLALLLKTFRMIQTVMIFVLGLFLVVGGAIAVLGSQFGIGTGSVDIFNTALEAGKGILTAFGELFGVIGGILSEIDWNAVMGVVLVILEEIFVYLELIIVTTANWIATAITGFAELIQAWHDAGFFQAIFEGAVTVVTAIIDTVAYFVNFLFTSGIFEFFMDLIGFVGETIGIIGSLAAIFISLYLRIWQTVGPSLIKFVKGFYDFLAPIIRIVLGIASAIIGMVIDLVQWLLPYIKDAADFMFDLLEPVLDLISGILGGVGDVMSYMGDGLSGLAGALGFSDGGIANGPTSGYPAILHGTEAVVPLPDGRSIPVSIKGDVGSGGGSTNNINISVSGSGNAREIAKAVSEEVSKAMRNKARNNSFSRGVM